MEQTIEPKMELMTAEPAALEQIERAQIDMQIATAKKYPRILAQVKSDMLSAATLDEETAAACFYTLPRGGKSIQGKSIRLAEIAVSCYGNLRAGTRVISEVTDGNNPHVVIQAVCHDLQKNVAVQIEKRRRITKKKFKDAPDEDDIQLAVNAGSAIAFRDAVFKIIPNAFTNPVMDAAKRVAIGDVKSLAARREQVVARLKQMGLTEPRIFSAVGASKIDEVDLTKLEMLIGLGTAIKEGQTSLEEAFPAEVKKPAAAPDIFGGQATHPGAPKSEPETVKPEDDLPDLDNPLDALKKLMVKDGITEAQVLQFCTARRIGKANQPNLETMSPDNQRRLVTGWDAVVKYNATPA